MASVSDRPFAAQSEQVPPTSHEWDDPTADPRWDDTRTEAPEIPPPLTPDELDALPDPSDGDGAWRVLMAEPVYEPTALDWTAYREHFDQTVNLADYVSLEAECYRSRRTTVSAFIADQLERIAQLIAFTSATTPDEFSDRLEIWDAEITESHFERGYAEGFEAGLRAARRQPA